MIKLLTTHAMSFLEFFSKHSSSYILCDSFFFYFSSSYFDCKYDCEGYKKSSPINLIVYSQKIISINFFFKRITKNMERTMERIGLSDHSFSNMAELTIISNCF